MKIDHTAFFAGYRAAFGKVTTSQVAGLELLLRNIEADPALNDLIANNDTVQAETAASYMLATVKHECADTWLPIVERGPRAYFDKYGSGALAKRLGNTLPGDGYLFRGRGYVQITGRGNYQKLACIAGLDLVAHPDDALRPAVAYQIMSTGMRLGLFTGKKISDYILDAPGIGTYMDRLAYRDMRRVINGMDQATKISEYAEQFEHIISEATA